MIGTAGTDEKVAFCLAQGADYAVNYRSADFVAFVDDVTNGRGVDVAFDTVGGAVTTDTFRTMAFNGRHLIIGFASGIEAEEHPLPIQPSIYGNFDLVGICFAYADSPRPARPFGMNFLSTAQGVEIWSRLLQLTQADQSRSSADGSSLPRCPPSSKRSNAARPWGAPWCTLLTMSEVLNSETNRVRSRGQVGHLSVHRLRRLRHVRDRHAQRLQRRVVDRREARERLDRVAQHLERDVGPDRQRRLLQPLTGFGPERVGAGQPLAVAEQRQEPVGLRRRRGCRWPSSAPPTAARWRCTPLRPRPPPRPADRCR